jgi:hypothetical protein
MSSDHKASAADLRDYQIRAVEQIELAIDAPFRSLSDRPSPAKPEAPRNIAYAKARAKECAA